MALDATELANKIHNALSQKKDKDGIPTPVSTETQEYASGIVAALKAAIVSNLPGTVVGVTAPGSPLSNGAATAGVMVITPAPMIAKTTKAIPAPDIITENTALIQYIGTGLITFAAGNITGTCTNTPVAPGPLVSGAGTGGQIIGLAGAACAGAVAAALGKSGPDSIKIYTAIIDYILSKAEVTYPTGTVQGVCPSGGGPLGGGFAAGGMIS